MLARAKINFVVAATLFAVGCQGVSAQERSPSSQPAPAQSLTSQKLSDAVEKALAYLRKNQLRDGGWTDYSGYRGGTTALALLAMLNAGVATNDPAIVKGMAVLLELPDESTYVASLKCQALSAYLQADGLTIKDPKSGQAGKHLSKSADWLIKAQLASRGSAGMWSYHSGAGGGDNSNTQFALLGLHESAKVGFAVPAATWQASANHYKNTQNADGGWGYRFSESSYGSMTAAGVASLQICGQKLNVGGEKKFVDGAYPDCGKYRQNEAIAAGIKWLGDHFTVLSNPGWTKTSWICYYMYAMERAGMISGTRYFGKHDWYRQGAERLVNTQNSDGSWPGGLNDTAFALLFLAKGNRPVIIQKLQWSDDPSKWNRNIHDLENLTNFIGAKFGKPTAWQSVSTSASLEDMLTAPVLLITGHEFPKFSAEEKEKFRQFVRGGGTILLEACCASKPFADGARAFCRELWPEYALRPLKLNADPVFTCFYKLDDDCGLEGLDAGCRTSVFFSPRAMSCLWELQDIPVHSRRAMELGANILAYATGREQLGGRIDAIYLPAAVKEDKEAEIPRGAVRIARLVHDGDYNADPNAVVNVSAMLRDKAGINIVTKSRLIKPTDKELFDYPVIFMTGHYDFSFSKEQLDALRTYLQQGGTIVADACCGKKEFDAAFRKVASQLFPNNPLRQLLSDNPIISGKVGLPLGRLKYRHILADELKSPDTDAPVLETVQINGRCAIIYSKYDFSCALEGDKPYSCRGYKDDDGRKLAFNIFLFAISY